MQIKTNDVIFLEKVKNYWNEEKRTQFEALRHKLDKERHDYALVAEDELHVMQGLRETEAELHRKQREVHELEECGDLVRNGFLQAFVHFYCQKRFTKHCRSPRKSWPSSKACSKSTDSQTFAMSNSGSRKWIGFRGISPGTYSISYITKIEF